MLLVIAVLCISTVTCAMHNISWLWMGFQYDLCFIGTVCIYCIVCEIQPDIEELRFLHEGLKNWFTLNTATADASNANVHIASCRKRVQTVQYSAVLTTEC